jgi:hypothetical protein
VLRSQAAGNGCYVAVRSHHEDQHSAKTARAIIRSSDPAKHAPDVRLALALQRTAGNRATAEVLAGRTTLQRVTAKAAKAAKKQRAPYRRNTRKKRGSSSGSYAWCTVSNGSVTGVVFSARPPSSSRRGQGDHIVAYSLIQNAMKTVVVGKTVSDAGSALAHLVTDAATFVKRAPINASWHANAQQIVGVLQDSSLQAGILQTRFNDVAVLLNIMPGSAVKNPRSTRGHGEGGAKGGVEHLERQVALGKPVAGNIWVNVFGLLDTGAQSGLLSDQSKLEQKLDWLMTLFSHAAPTVVGKLKGQDHTLMAQTDLEAAAQVKFGAVMAIGAVDQVKGFLGLQ